MIVCGGSRVTYKNVNCVYVFDFIIVTTDTQKFEIHINCSHGGFSILFFVHLPSDWN